MHRLYRTTHKIFVSGKPELSQELDKGLILAISGYCEQKERFLFRCSKYTVAMKNGVWQCNCPANEFATINELYGNNGNICKHICAIAICFSVNAWIVPPKNILELVKRLVDIDYVIDYQLPYSKVKLTVENNQLFIKSGRKKSDALAINPDKWKMIDNSRSLYEDFVNDIQP